MFKFSDEYIKLLLERIYSGEYTADNLPDFLYYSIADYLKSGVYEGFGGSKLSDFVDSPDYALLTELRENVYMFSAAKTFQQVREISSLLTDGDRVRTLAEFNKLGREMFDTWNIDWGKSEYNTAIASASMANKWDDIERSKDILPIISYSTIGDACDICAPLDGLALPVDNAAWKTIYPPNHFNCLCIVTQHEDKELTPSADARASVGKVSGKMSDVFKMNSGRDKVIFNEDHPYFDVEAKYKKLANNNFNLPIPSPEEELKQAA